MEEIFEMQRQLNILTLRKIGLDYAEVITDQDTIPVWIENYRKAFSAELAELVREIEKHGLGSQNGKIEIIDMLHFLVSLSHIVRIDPAEALMDPAFKYGAKVFMETFLALDELQNSVKWKWWAKGGGYKPDSATNAVRKLWLCFWEMCVFYLLDFEAVKKIYTAKNEINFQRQHQGYSEDTKTEKDNRKIKVD
jgi:hypothetical protein